MKNEERDIYILPPNFIEGGTFMGGMLKTRNVIEAGIIGAVIGWPVMQMSLSLTTRIIILCLTALPLVLFALIGVSGESLSSFLLLLLSWFRNRRTLHRDGATEDKRQKPLIPSWAKGARGAADDTPKSRNCFRVDVKRR